MGQIYFREEFLHFVWKMKRFDLKGLTTIMGEPIQMIHFGFHNHNAGPDFLESKLKIGDTLWAGHVEMHIKSSDWNLHKHQFDTAYNNVILHVVYEHDKEVYTENGNQLPCLILKPRISKDLLNQYMRLETQKLWIPCADQIHLFSESKMLMFLHGLSIERLEAKATIIKKEIESHNMDWEQVFYETLCKYFGFKVNNHAFERLANTTPLKLIRKYTHDPTKLEALLMGQSGLIEGEDSYAQLLLREYTVLSAKHSLTPLNKMEWKFSRLRPANFPSIRLAQIIALLQKESALFLHIQNNINYKYLIEFLKLDPNAYWDTHYCFGVESKLKKKSLGKQSIDLILINVIVPVLFLYGKTKKDQRILDKTSELLENIKAERNVIIDRWKDLGVKPLNASESQALIHLKKNYCEKFRCLECQIGNKILSS